MTVQGEIGSRRREPRRALRLLPPHSRRALLCWHVVSSVGWLGIDIGILVLVATGWGGAARLLGYAVLLPLALLSYVSGLLLGTLTPWGLLRYWWVAVKLALSTVGLALSVLVLLPGPDGPAPAAAAAAAGLLLALLVSAVLSVVKPFGRINR